MATGSTGTRWPENITARLVDTAYRRFVHYSHDYMRLLDDIHQHVVPRTYVEVGVADGRTLALALPGTKVIGIDPKPEIVVPLSRSTRVFATTSDDFFAQNDLASLLGHQPVDLAFIDGMHLFEFALRDFMNLERYASESTTILVHDCYPINEKSARRERETKVWTGDVWKLIVCLKQWRPDLRIDVVDVPPAGLGIITGLKPDSTVLADHLTEITEQYLALPFAYLERGGKLDVLNAVANDWATVQALLPGVQHRDAHISQYKWRKVVHEVTRVARQKVRGRLHAMRSTRSK